MEILKSATIPALPVAEVTVHGDRNSAAYAGFRKLAGFIFGANSRKQSIEMTAPVIEARADGAMATSALTEPAGSSPSWVIRFVMPRGFSLAALPKPDDLSIRLREEPPTRFAVLRFSGLAGDAAIAAKTAELEVDAEGSRSRACRTADRRAIRSAVDPVVHASQRGDDSDQDVNLDRVFRDVIGGLGLSRLVVRLSSCAARSDGDPLCALQRKSRKCAPDKRIGGAGECEMCRSAAPRSRWHRASELGPGAEERRSGSGPEAI